MKSVKLIEVTEMLGNVLKSGRSGQNVVIIENEED